MTVGRVEQVAAYCSTIKEKKQMVSPNDDRLREMTAYWGDRWMQVQLYRQKTLNVHSSCGFDTIILIDD